MPDSSIIGFTNGCFDILHEGHLHLLKEAKKHCDTLFVAINSDASVKRLKRRLINSFDNRASALIKTKLVNGIGEFDTEDDLERLIRKIQPEVLIKGADYMGKKITGDNLVDKTVLVSLLHGYSTTALLGEKYEQAV